MEVIGQQQGMKRAVAAMMREAHARDVEGLGVGGHRGAALRDEHELRLGVEPAANEPSTAHAIDAHPCPGGPPHWVPPFFSPICVLSVSRLSVPSSPARARSPDGAWE